MARLAVFDPITQGYSPLDGGVSVTLLYQILVELRVMNAQMQKLVDPNVDEVQQLRNDMTGETSFTQVR